jgi:hypothetical protein
MRDDKALHGGELLKVGLSGEVDVKAQTGFVSGGNPSVVHGTFFV